MNHRRALIITAVAGLALIGVSVTSSHDHTTRPDQQPARPPATTPEVPSATTPPPTADRTAAQLLPFSQGQIAAAAALATRFTATYAGHRYDESPRTYLGRLTPMMSTQLRPIIARAATDPTTLTQRRHDHEIATAHAQAEIIRALGPTSITLVISATTQVTTPYTNRRRATRYAVTVIRSGEVWKIYAIELAATGDVGDAGDRP